MWSYLARRLALMLVTLWGITVITFAIISITPGLVGVTGLGEAGGLDAEKRAAIREFQRKLLNLDKPFHVRYWLWVERSARLDFGLTRDNRPVIERVLQALPATIYLNLASDLLIYLITIPLGIYSATHLRSLPDKAITLGLYILYSLPAPFVGLLLLMLLAEGGLWPLFPIGKLNILDEGKLAYFPWLADRLWHMVLPVVCLTYGGLAFLSRFQRNNMLEVLRQDYIRTAKAKGLRSRTVIYKHALRNSLIPLVTIFATLLPGMIGGSVIVEQIFSIDGMGRLAFQAVLNRDINTVMCIATVSALLTLAGILIVDLLYVVIDPRISLARRVG